MLFILTILLSIVSWAYILIRIEQNFKNLPFIRKKEEEEKVQLPPLSVIIPVRNEKNNLEELLPFLVNCRYGGKIEILIIDDESDDGTRQVVERFIEVSDRIRYIEPEGLPAGWLGKTFSLHRGFISSNQSSKYLLFLDADVRLEEGAFDSIVHFAEESGADLICALCKPIYKTFSERLIMPSATSILAPFMRVDRVNDPRRREAFAIGHSILVKRRSLLNAGGFSSIRGEILDDIELARLLKGKGFRIEIASAEDLLKVRMYRDMGGVLSGLAKNGFLLLGKRSFNLLCFSIYIIFAHILPFILPFYPIVRSEPLPFLLSLLPLGMLLFYRRGVNRLSDTPFLFAILHPIGASIYLSIHIYSYFMHTFGKGVRWKGRKVSAAL